MPWAVPVNERLQQGHSVRSKQGAKKNVFQTPAPDALAHNIDLRQSESLSPQLRLELLLCAKRKQLSIPPVIIYSSQHSSLSDRFWSKKLTRASQPRKTCDQALSSRLSHFSGQRCLIIHIRKILCKNWKLLLKVFEKPKCTKLTNITHFSFTRYRKIKPTFSEAKYDLIN